MGQGDRDDVITGFKKKAFPILVATDVAGKRICVLLIICMLAALFVIAHKWNMFWYSGYSLCLILTMGLYHH